MDKNERTERQKWLKDMANMFDDTGRIFGEKALDQIHVDNFILDWIKDAPFFAKQFRNRADVYDLDFIKNAETDAELKKAVESAHEVLKKLFEKLDREETGYVIEAQRLELGHILECIVIQRGDRG